MTPEEKEEFWRISVDCARVWDERLLKAFITSFILRHGDLVTCDNGCHTYPVHKITIEELHNVVEHYNLGLVTPEVGVFELSAVPKEWGGVDEQKRNHDYS